MLTVRSKISCAFKSLQAERGPHCWIEVSSHSTFSFLRSLHRSSDHLSTLTKGHHDWGQKNGASNLENLKMLHHSFKFLHLKLLGKMHLWQY